MLQSSIQRRVGGGEIPNRYSPVRSYHKRYKASSWPHHALVLDDGFLAGPNLPRLIATRLLRQVFHEHHFVLLFVVNQFVHGSLGQQQPETAGA